MALALWHRYLGKPRTRHPGDQMQGTFLGPSYSEEEIGAWVSEQGHPVRRLSREELPRFVAQLIAEGKVVGLFQGRMEFGPRALGGRSILGDPRSPTMQSLMNLKIKFRESFRPFAPSVLRERVSEWFERGADSPYMLLVADVASHRRRAMTDAGKALQGLDKLRAVRSDIPAVTHVDNSARIQTVRRETNPLFYDILRAFDELTGCPMVINTSFNVRGEPIVCTPEDAFRCFMRTQMDALVLESFVLTKEQQPSSAPEPAWQGAQALD